MLSCLMTQETDRLFGATKNARGAAALIDYRRDRRMRVVLLRGAFCVVAVWLLLLWHFGLRDDAAAAPTVRRISSSYAAAVAPALSRFFSTTSRGSSPALSEAAQARPH